jgi:TetR/AcrR family fatty acid metabolism transcriptional regulator
MFLDNKPINNMIKKNTQNLSKKDEILKVGMEVFAQQFYHEATISSIAEKAGVAEATIYEYFRNKEDLLFSIPEEKMKEVCSLANLHLQGIKGALNKIRKFIWLYLWVYENNPEWASVVMLNLKTNKRFINTSGYQLFRDFIKIVNDTVEEGKSEGSIRKEVNGYTFRSILLGTIEHITMRWLILHKPEKLTSLHEEIADLLIEAVKVRGENI